MTKEIYKKNACCMCKVVVLLINPLSCKSDQHQNSPCNIQSGRENCENSLSIRRFWGKRGKMEAKKGKSWRRQTPDTDAFAVAFHPHSAWFDTIQSKSPPAIGLSATRVKKLAWNKSHLTVWASSGACVATISLFSETCNEEFLNTCNGKPAVFEEL